MKLRNVISLKKDMYTDTYFYGITYIAWLNGCVFSDLNKLNRLNSPCIYFSQLFCNEKGKVTHCIS